MENVNNKSPKLKLVACYVRVSTADQRKGMDSQVRALEQYCANHGWDNLRWYKDVLTGAATRRPAFEKLQRDIFLGQIETVVTWKLDRISRKGIKEGISILTDWLRRQIRFISVTQQLDFSGPVGELLASILFALAAMERENLRENTKRGLEAAKARGVHLGRPVTVQIPEIEPLLAQGLSVRQIARKLGRGHQTIYNALKRAGRRPGKVPGRK